MKTNLSISKLFFFLLIFFACSACSLKQNSQQSQNDDFLSLKYAIGFSIKTTNQYKEVCVYNPWKQGEILSKYYLVKDDTTQTPSDGICLKIPLKRIATTSCTHIGFLEVLDELSGVVGTCMPNLIYNFTIREAYKNGIITDLGDPLNINIEKTMYLHPQAVMVSGYNQTDVNSNRLQRVNIPVIINVEWMENTLLARAEWIKFIAAFYDKDRLADSLFTEVAKQYECLREIANNQMDASLPMQQRKKPAILTGGNFRGTWYVPSGTTYMAKLFADAGGDYFYANDSTSGSLPLNIEMILKNFADADVWVGSSANSLLELAEMDAKHTLFKAYKNREVYNFNRRITVTGGNDFWEMGVAHPDLILADMIKILYPDLLPEHTFVFAKKLQ